MSNVELNNQEKLEEVYEMTLENNKILRGLRRQQSIGIVFKALYWIVIIASLGGAYYYIRPLVNAFTGGNTSMTETIKQLDQMRSQLPEAKLLDQFFKKGETKPLDGTTTDTVSGQ